MAGPDLAAARKGAEALMDDSVIITRDPNGADDATMDPDTLELVGPGQPFVATEIYGVATTGDGGRLLAGKARIRPVRRVPATDESGGRTFVSHDYVVSIPWDAPALLARDVVTVSASSRDPELAGKVLVVREAPVHTYLSVRQAIAELRS